MPRKRNEEIEEAEVVEKEIDTYVKSNKKKKGSKKKEGKK